MAFKDRFRRAVGRSDDRASISSSSTGKHTNGATTPTHPTDAPTPLTTTKTATEKSNAPDITLTKTHSRLGKTLTWHSSSKPSKKEATKDKQLKNWEKEDAVEWTSPMSQRPGRKDMGCQNQLRAFDFRKAALGGEEGKDRSRSVGSGISPSGSRVGSVDEGISLSAKRNSSGAVGPGKLSQELTRDEKEVGIEKKQGMAGVKEE